MLRVRAQGGVGRTQHGTLQLGKREGAEFNATRNAKQTRHWFSGISPGWLPSIQALRTSVLIEQVGRCLIRRTDNAYVRYTPQGTPH